MSSAVAKAADTKVKNGKHSPSKYNGLKLSEGIKTPKPDSENKKSELKTNGKQEINISAKNKESKKSQSRTSLGAKTSPLEENKNESRSGDAKSNKTFPQQSQPFSNILVLPNGRVAGSKQQSKVFDAPLNKVSPRGTLKHEFRTAGVMLPPVSSERTRPQDENVPWSTRKDKMLYSMHRFVQRTVKHMDPTTKQWVQTSKKPKLKLSKSEANFVRHAKMVTTVGTDLLRVALNNYLDRQHPPKHLHEFLNKNKRRLKSHSTGAYHLLWKRWDLLYPLNEEKNATIEAFDAALIFWLLRYICNMKRSNDFIWRRKPSPDDLSEAADVVRIRDHRNFIINLSVPAVYDDEFERKLKDFKEVAERLGGPKYLARVEELSRETVKFHERDQYLDILERWAEETDDRDIAPYSSGNNELIARKGNTGDGKTTTAICLMVAKYDEDECLLITSPDQWEYVEPRAVSAILIDDIFGSGSLDENLLEKWYKKFDTVLDYSTERPDTPNVQIIVCVRNHILDQCYSRLSTHPLFRKDKIIDVSSSELSYREKRTMLSRHLLSAGRTMTKSDIDKSSKVHQSKLGYPQCCALLAAKETILMMGSQFFEKPIESLRYTLGAMYDLDKMNFFAMVVMMFEKDGILFAKKFQPDVPSKEFKDKVLDLAVLCQISATETVFADVLNALPLLAGIFVNYYEDRDCYTFSHESIMEAMMACFGEKHPEQILEGCSLSFLTDFVGTPHSSDEGEVFIMRVNNANFGILAKIVAHYLLQGEVKRVAQHRSLKDLEFLDFFFEYLLKEGKQKMAILKQDNTAIESAAKPRKVGLLLSSVDQEVPNKELVAAILKTGVLDDPDAGTWGQEEKKTALDVAVKRGSFEIYEIMANSGFNLPDVLLSDEQYLVSSDIVKDLLKRRDWTTDQKNIALVKASRGTRAQSLDIIRILLENGASVNCFACGTTPLCEAAKMSKSKTAQLLLGEGANVQNKDANLQTPLHLALDYNNLETIKLLMKKKADVNIPDNRGLTPFLVAVGWGREAPFELLRTRTTDILIKDAQDNTVLHLCAASGRSSIMKILLDNYPEEMLSILISRNKQGWTPLDFALRCGHYVIMKMLMDQILHTTYLRSYGRTFVQTRFVLVRTDDYDLNERHTYRFVDPNTNKTCLQLPRGNWFIQAGSKEEYEKVREYSLKFENKLKQALMKSVG
ncbi:hypothetical protein ACJMK2_013174 [Sinanodonta woodiana]|uniref:Uncharacterized protein n=1 Tax=Sinanodonta woodiana TaxID=1069815 RepID=A0ABD3UXP1_SINWO